MSNNEESTVENLENLTVEELEAKAQELEAAETIDWETRAKDAEKKAAILQRIANKKPKTITTENKQAADVTKDIEEIKFIHKVSSFAEEHDLTKAQAEKVLKLYPNADAETLKDPFVASGIKAMARKERVQDSTPGAGKSTTVGGKTFKEMTPEERAANFEKIIQG